MFGLPTFALLAVGLPWMAGCNHPPNSDIVATVNGQAIPRSEMESRYKVQLGEAQQQPSNEEAESLRIGLVRELIQEEILQQRAKKMNLTATPEEVEARLAEMKVPYTEEQFAAQLKAKALTLDDLKRDLRRSVTIEKLQNKEINSKITVSDADIANYYNQHKAEFNLIDTQYHLAVIQVTNLPSPQSVNLQGSKASSDPEAKKKIQGIKSELDSGQDFGTLAMNFSEDPQTASNGGDMGFVNASEIVRQDPAIYAAVSKLKAGETTEVLPLLNAQTKKPGGYAIYKLLSREPPGQRELNDPRVQQNIRQQLRDVRAQLLKLAYFEMLHNQAKIENFYAEDIFKNDAK
jgi:peptidyl-prolyl cis-trans isomerase SurA